MVHTYSSRQDAKHYAARQLEHIESHPNDKLALGRYQDLTAVPWLAKFGTSGPFFQGEEAREAWLKRQRALWGIYHPVDPMITRNQATFPDPDNHWIYQYHANQIANREIDHNSILREIARYGLSRNLFPRARYADNITWSQVKREGISLMEAVAAAALREETDEPFIAIEDARAILNRLRALVGRIGYKLEMVSTIGGNPPPGRPDGLWAIPKNEPTDYMARFNFARCVHLTSDGNGIEKAILACQALPILAPNGYRALSIEEPNHEHLRLLVADQAEFLLRQLTIARERAAKKAAPTT